MTTFHGHTNLLGELRFDGEAGTAGLVALSGGSGSGPSWGQVGSVALADLAVITSKIAAGAVDATKVDLADDYTWGGSHEFDGPTRFDDDLDVNADIALAGALTIAGKGNARGLFFEGGNHGILVNDGYGNFNIVVGRKIDSGEVISEDGHAFKQQFDQGDGDWTLFVSQDGVVDDAITWTTALRVNHASTQLEAYGSKVWTVGNDGSGSGLDADLLDGYQASEFPRKAETATIDGAWTFDSPITFADEPDFQNGVNVSSGNITLAASAKVDGRDVSADGAKLDGIESGATADQTAGEISTLMDSLTGWVGVSELEGASTFSETVATSGWKTIAYVVNNRGSARFMLHDKTSGRHGTVVFYASHHFGHGDSISVVSNAQRASPAFTGIRIKSSATYDGALLQVNLRGTSQNVTAFAFENLQSSGWFLVDWLDDGTDPGGLGDFAAVDAASATSEVDLTVGELGTGVFPAIFASEVWFGGQTTQYEGMHLGMTDMVTTAMLQAESVTASEIDISDLVAVLTEVDDWIDAGALDTSANYTFSGEFEWSSASYKNHRIHRNAAGNATLQFLNSTENVYIGVGATDGELRVGSAPDLLTAGDIVFHEGNLDGTAIATLLDDVTGWISSAEIAAGAVIDSKIDTVDGAKLTGVFKRQQVSDWDDADLSSYGFSAVSGAFQAANRPGGNFSDGFAVQSSSLYPSQFAFTTATFTRASAYIRNLNWTTDEWNEWSELWHESNTSDLIAVLQETDDWIGSGEIADGAVGTAQLAADSITPDKLNLDVGFNGRDFDASANGEIWSQVHSTSGTDGTWPTNYVFGVNLGGYKSQGLQLAAAYSSNDGLWFRRGSDNAGSTNGANAWQPWYEIAHTGKAGVVSTSMLANDAVDATKVDLADNYDWTGDHDFDGALTIGGNTAYHQGNLDGADIAQLLDAVTGWVSSAEIASLDAAKLTGTINAARFGDDSIALDKLATQNPWTVLGNATGTVANPTAITATQLIGVLNQGTGSIDADLIPEAAVTQYEGDLSIAFSQITGTIDADTLGGSSKSAFALSIHAHSASDITSGTFPSARIADKAVTFGKLPDVAAGHVIGREADSGTGEVSALDGAAVRTIAEVDRPIYAGASAPGSTAALWFHTTDHEWYAYDGTRSKWLSIATYTISTGRSGTISSGAGHYMRLAGSVDMVASSPRGWMAPFDVTVVGWTWGCEGSTTGWTHRLGKYDTSASSSNLSLHTYAPSGTYSEWTEDDLDEDFDHQDRVGVSSVSGTASVTNQTMTIVYRRRPS